MVPPIPECPARTVPGAVGGEARNLGPPGPGPSYGLVIPVHGSSVVMALSGQAGRVSQCGIPGMVSRGPTSSEGSR